MNSSAPLSLSQALTLSLLSPSRTAIGHPLLASLRCPPHGLAQPHGPATSLSLTAVFTQPHGLTASLNHSLIHVFPPSSPFFFLWVHFYLSLLKLWISRFYSFFFFNLTNEYYLQFISLLNVSLCLCLCLCFLCLCLWFWKGKS